MPMAMETGSRTGEPSGLCQGLVSLAARSARAKMKGQARVFPSTDWRVAVIWLWSTLSAAT